VAVVVVWLNRRTMFRRGEGVTEILMSESAGAEIGRESGQALPLAEK